MRSVCLKEKSIFLDLTIRYSPTRDHFSQNCWPLSGVSRTPQCKAPVNCWLQHTPCAVWQCVLHRCYLLWADVASCHSSSVQWWLHGVRSWLAPCRKCFQLAVKEIKTCWENTLCTKTCHRVSKSHPVKHWIPLYKHMWEWNWQPLGLERGNSTQWHVHGWLTVQKGQPWRTVSCERLAPEQGHSGTGQLKPVSCGRTRDAKCQESQTIMHEAAEQYYTHCSNCLCHLHLESSVCSKIREDETGKGGG